jgi:hypothetical protein
MKAIFILLAFVTLSVSGQKSKSGVPPTTEDEYKYLTKGYLVAEEVGLDLKKGYIIEELGKVKDGYCNFVFKALIREKENELAGILVIVKSDLEEKPYSFCIPQNNVDLMKRYFDDLNTLDSSMIKSYTRVLSVYFGQAMYSKFELQKKGKR